jgi:hypothetical protein
MPNEKDRNMNAPSKQGNVSNNDKDGQYRSKDTNEQGELRSPNKKNQNTEESEEEVEE